MSFTVNTLIQEAAEELNLVSIGDPVEGRQAAACEGCLNSAIRWLNGDGYISLTTQVHDIVASGRIYFRKLEEGESKPNTVDMEPPDGVGTVARKVGMRYVRIIPSSRDALDRTITYSYATKWCYGEETETAPSGKTRRVGIIYTNGNYPTEMRVYLNSQLPSYKLGDTIYLSSLYYNLLLYATEMKMVGFFKLASYKEGTKIELDKAMAQIDRKHVNNEALNPEGLVDLVDPYADVISGNGL